MKIAMDLAIRFAGGLIAALLSNLLLNMGHTLRGAVVFSVFFALIGYALHWIAVKAGWLHD